MPTHTLSLLMFLAEPSYIKNMHSPQRNLKTWLFTHFRNISFTLCLSYTKRWLLKKFLFIFFSLFILLFLLILFFNSIPFSSTSSVSCITCLLLWLITCLFAVWLSIYCFIWVLVYHNGWTYTDRFFPNPGQWQQKWIRWPKPFSNPPNG